MATNPTIIGMIPSQTPLADKKGLVTNAWYHWFRDYQTSIATLVADSPYVKYTLPPSTVGSEPTILEGTLAELDTGAAGYIYFTTDTNQIFLNVGGTYVEQVPAFSGDASNPPGSTILTLATVNPFYVGTYTNATITVNEKGLVTYAANGTSSGEPSLPVYSVQYNGGGTFAGDPDLTWNPITGILTVTGTIVPTTITDTTDSVGSPGQILTSTGSGLEWQSPAAAALFPSIFVGDLDCGSCEGINITLLIMGNCQGYNYGAMNLGNTH